MSMLQILILVLFPPAILGVAMLALPWPRFLLKSFRWFLEKTLFLRVWDVATGGKALRLSVYHVLVILSGFMWLVFAMDGWSRQSRIDKIKSSEVNASYATLEMEMMSKWRAERNAWMSAFAFTLYIVLDRFHALVRKLDAAAGPSSPEPGPSSSHGFGGDDGDDGDDSPSAKKDQ